MKRYYISLGDFSTREEAQAFANLLIKNYAEGWTPGEPTILEDSYEIEEYERKNWEVQREEVKLCEFGIEA